MSEQRNPNLAKESLKLIKAIMGFGNRPPITAKQAYERCCEMNKKCPGIGWHDTAMKFRIKMDEEVPF